MLRNERVLSSSPGRVQIEPQQDSVTNWVREVVVSKGVVHTWGVEGNY